jgi:DNA-binding transcriptional regulator GbsR (MarR family)
MESANDTPINSGTRLSPLAQEFVIHWGEMGARWGVNRTVGQIHALLYFHARPMHAEEIVELLGVARSNVSNSLRELQGWKLVKVVHLLGDRRDHFEAIGDVWSLFKTVVTERKTREFDPTVNTLAAIQRNPDFSKEPIAAQQRIKEMHELMKNMSEWTTQILELSPKTLTRGMKLGASIQKFLG